MISGLWLWVPARAPGGRSPAARLAGMTSREARSPLTPYGLPCLAGGGMDQVCRSSVDSELERAGMPDAHRACIGGLARPDLPESRFHLVNEQVDDVAGTKRAERAEAP
jgi:hypothetical protein